MSLKENVLMITANTTDPDSLWELSQVLNAEFPNTRFIITTEELKVTDLDKLEAQLKGLLQYVQKIKAADKESEEQETPIPKEKNRLADEIVKAIQKEREISEKLKERLKGDVFAPSNDWRL